MRCEIAGRGVGRGEPLFVVAELGLNHGGSVERALAMVDAAAAARASAVKVQSLFADDLVVDGGPPLAHVGKASLREFFRAFELDEDAHRAIATRARVLGMAFLATPFSLRAVDMLERVGVDAYKIASGDITFGPLIARCASTGKPLILATGMASLPEVGEALQTARAAGARQIVVLHCVSAYPIPAGSENLGAIATLAQSCGTLVGLSDHAPDLGSVPVAVALGASVYERHVMLPGSDSVDAPLSSTPEALRAAIEAAERTRQAIGHGRKECLPAEAGNLQASRRSLHAAVALRRGDQVGADDVICLRPATGLPPSQLAGLVGVRIGRDVAAGAAFDERDLLEQDSRCDAA